jgi:3-dehydroquinate dehydratase-2
MPNPKKILVLNGPNLNLLGTREPDIYGRVTLDDIEAEATDLAEDLGLGVEFRQSNHEGELIDWVQGAASGFAGIVLNAGGFTHTSVALHDALKLARVPIIEVHISNIYKREEFRHRSLVSPVADGIICGLGAHGYILAIEAIARMIEE